MNEKLNEIAKWIADAYRNQLEKDGTLASGALYRSIHEYVEIEGDKYYVTIELEDYWKYVENGRKAGKFPPINKIRDWIEVKPVVPTSVNGKVPTTNQLAYLISRKIANEGIEGKHSLEKAMKGTDNWIKQFCDIIVEEYHKEINEIIK